MSDTFDDKTPDWLKNPQPVVRILNPIKTRLIDEHCYFCGVQLVSAPQAEIMGRTPPDNFITEEHLIPRRHGGTRGKGNTVWACKKCNEDKANLKLEEYRVVIAYRRGLLNAFTLVKFWGEQCR